MEDKEDKSKVSPFFKDYYLLKKPKYNKIAFILMKIFKLSLTFK